MKPGQPEIDVRTKLAELTSDVRCQVDLDAIVSRAGGLGNLYRTEFPEADEFEFMYEWEAMKLKFGGRMTRED